MSEESRREFERWFNDQEIGLLMLTLHHDEDLAWEVWQAARKEITEQRDRLADAMRELADSCITIDGQERGALKSAREALAAVNG